MGRRDSSKTRVAPVFDRLLAGDSTGATWLARLVALADRGDGHPLPLPPAVGSLRSAAWQGRPGGERRLAPPLSLLRSLVAKPPLTRPPSDYGTRDPVKREARRLLFRGDEMTRLQAMTALDRDGLVEGGWYVFEGRTSVDAYLETEHLIVLVEGKRTETRPTTKTQWMPVRHQMLRNIDDVWDIRAAHAAVGFFIVEGQEPDERRIPPAWRRFVKQTVSADALAASLPHRREDERQAIARSFAGATTWQNVCAEFGIDWDEIRDLEA